MKDAFTAALSEVVQHQIELTSTIDSLLNDQASQETSSHGVDEVRRMLVQFNAQVSALANRLAARYDENLPLFKRMFPLPERSFLQRSRR